MVGAMLGVGHDMDGRVATFGAVVYIQKLDYGGVCQNEGSMIVEWHEVKWIPVLKNAHRNFAVGKIRSKAC